MQITMRDRLVEATKQVQVDIAGVVFIPNAPVRQLGHIAVISR